MSTGLSGGLDLSFLTGGGDYTPTYGNDEFLGGGISGGSIGDFSWDGPGTFDYSSPWGGDPMYQSDAGSLYGLNSPSSWGTPYGYDSDEGGYGVSLPSGGFMYGGEPSYFDPSASAFQGSYQVPQAGMGGYFEPGMEATVGGALGSVGGALGSLNGALDTAARYMATPAGKMLSGILGAGVSAYGAKKQNKALSKAQKKQAAELAARKAEMKRYDEPLRLKSDRVQIAAPEARRGESLFFSGNKLPSYYADGGGVSEEDLERMQQEAYQARLDAKMDQPSMVGFLRYLASGKRMPSEVAAAKRAQRPTTVDVITARNRALEEAANYACGGSTGYIHGGTAGQDDTIPAMLSDGEYVFDADVVSALGDGNNEAGAAKLDAMRQQIRSHKRSAPADSIPPKAKSPLAYMKKGAK